jgi:hypothetical protein
MSSTIGDSIRRRHGAAPQRAPGQRLRWGRIALFGLGGAAVAFGLGYVLAVFVLFPAPPLSAPGIVVPRLLGQDTGYAGRVLAQARLRLGSVTEVPDPGTAAGAVVAQDALPGQQLRAGATVNVAVSSGAATAVLPDVTGYAAPRAAALLAALGFKVTQVSVPANAAAGLVAGISPQPGVAYDLPAQVILSVSAGPPPDTTTTAADSLLRPDSLGGAVPDGGASAPAPNGLGNPPGAPGAVHPPVAAPGPAPGAAHPPMAAPGPAPGGTHPSASPPNGALPGARPPGAATAGGASPGPGSARPPASPAPTPAPR